MIDFRMAKKYLAFISGATPIGSVHSPFAYEFYAHVLKDKRGYYSFRPIEKLRTDLLKNNTRIKVTELGAGSRVDGNVERRIGDIARHAAKKPKYGQLLYRMVNYFNPKNILELGTSLGLSTAYLASARSHSQVTTLEGWPEVLEIAKETFKVLQLKNVTPVAGNFDDTLPEVLSRLPALDFAFIDGNHREEPTIRYFEQCITKVHNNSILIFDDIYWTPEMERAWEAIKSHPSITLTIDIFSLGFVFFRKEIKEKQHFKFRY